MWPMGLLFSLFVIIAAEGVHVEWRKVFVAESGGPFRAYEFFKDKSRQGNLNDSDKNHYKSPIINEWTNIKKVKLSIIRNGLQVAFLIFDGRGSTSDSWFSKHRLIKTSYKDLLNTTTFNFFSLEGDMTQGLRDRRFLISLHYGGCTKNTGWLVMTNSRGSSCAGDYVDSLTIFFSPSDTKSKYDDFEIADSLEMYIIQRRMCPCSDYLQINDTAILRTKIFSIISKLKITKNETSAYKRRKNCAPDERTSSFVIGSVLGIALLTAAILLIVFSDVQKLLVHTRTKRKKHIQK